MSRRRVLVAVVPPPAILESSRLLRRLLGDVRPERIVPHITVVPPVNIDDARFDDVRKHVRKVTNAARSFDVMISGFDSFRPSTPTIHLEVEERDGHHLAQLKEALMRGDLERPDNHPFRPHITVRDRADDKQIAGVLDAFDPTWARPNDSGDSHQAIPYGHSLFQPWTIDRVHLMEQFRSEERGTFWVTISEEPLGAATVVGRGGVELIIRVAGTVEPAAVELLGVPAAELNQSNGMLSVTAELPDGVGEPVGVAAGRFSETGAVLEHLAVSPDSRWMGVARQLLSHWCHAAAVAGAPAVIAHHVEGATVLSEVGFSPVGNLWVRELG